MAIYRSAPICNIYTALSCSQLTFWYKLSRWRVFPKRPFNSRRPQMSQYVLSKESTILGVLRVWIRKESQLPKRIRDSQCHCLALSHLTAQLPGLQCPAPVLLTKFHSSEDVTYLLTYLLTPWCRVLLDKLTGLQLVKKFPAFHGTRRFITALTSVRHLSISRASPILSIYPHSTSWRSILILSTHLRLGLPSGLLPSGSPIKTLYTPLHAIDSTIHKRDTS